MIVLAALLACEGDVVEAPEPERFTDIALGASYACAVAMDGGIQCWGESGVPTIPGNAWADVEIELFSGCAVDRLGYACCWGVQGVPSCEAGPTLGPLRDLVLYGGAPEDGWMCAVLPDASLGCWGPGLDAPSIVLPSGTDIASLAASSGRLLVLHRDNTISTFDIDFSGARVLPVAVRGDLGLAGQRVLTTGGWYVATPDSGVVWGFDHIALASFVVWVAPAGMVQVRSGGTLCGRYSDGHITCLDSGEWAWLDSANSDVGLEPSPDLQFRTFDDLDHFSSSEPANHCGILFDGSISCWGVTENHPIFTEHP